MWPRFWSAGVVIICYTVILALLAGHLIGHRHRWSRANRRLSSILSDDCMRCLCAASSECKVNARCRVVEPDKYFCGPYRITEQYWLWAGQPKPPNVWSDNPLDFELCALDLSCSMSAVRRFLRKYLLQCDWLEKMTEERINSRDMCQLMALVHYHTIYASSSSDPSTDEELEEEEENSEETWMAPCYLNFSSISSHIEQLNQNAPSTRSDEGYWDHFDRCSNYFLV